MRERIPEGGSDRMSGKNLPTIHTREQDDR